jgi:predicted FMN-binding regulatory protein PaiB
MFVRPTWKQRSDDEVLAFIDAYPWALLVNNGVDGPWATNLPRPHQAASVSACAWFSAAHLEGGSREVARSSQWLSGR